MQPNPETVAEQGFYVFPVDPVTKRPVIPDLSWRDYSTNDPAEVRRLWAEYPGAAIGIDTGKSNLVVLDLDLKDGENGPQEWERIIHYRRKDIPETFRVRTPSGGLHLYFRDPQGLFKTTTRQMGPGIDTRAVGGYAVLWGWESEAPESVQDIPLAPSGLFPIRDQAEELDEDPFSSPSRVFTRDQAEELFIRPALEKLRTAPSGTINNTLNSSAMVLSHFVNGGFLTEEEARERLMEALEETEWDNRGWNAEATIRSGLSAPGWVATVAEAPKAPDVSPWLPVDLDAFLDGEGVPPPEVGKREDGAHLFYKGRVNTVYGESEALKSWLCQVAAVQEITSGNDVVYVDLEDSPGGVVERLQLLGATREHIREHFRYVSPDGPLDEAAKAALGPILRNASLMVLDATTEALAQFGLSSNSDVDVAAFMALFPRWAASLGPAVVLIDHAPKDKENRNGPTGSQHKRSGLSGVSILMEPKEALSRGGTGLSLVYVNKDRLGHVRGMSVDGKWFGTFTLDATKPGVVWYRLQAPMVDAKGPKSDEPKEALVASILKVIRTEEAQGKPPTGNGIVDLVQGRKSDKLQALAWLVGKGRVTVENGPRNSRIYRVNETEESE